ATAGRARKRARANCRVAGAGFVEATVAGKAPRAVDEHPDADALALDVADGLDAPVLRGDRLGAPEDAASIRVRSACAQCCVYGCSAQVAHALTVNGWPVRLH